MHASEEAGSRPGPGARARRPRWVLIALTVIGWLPFCAMALSSAVAAWLGCGLNEAAAQPCTVAGVDVSEWLYVGFVSGWLMVYTLPLMLGTAVAWLVVGVKRFSAARGKG